MQLHFHICPVDVEPNGALMLNFLSDLHYLSKVGTYFLKRMGKCVKASAQHSESFAWTTKSE